MYRFNLKWSYPMFIGDGFKYNPCIGSIDAKNAKSTHEPHLNTTHVSVQSS